MAGYWIKFDTSTPDKPEVWAIADQLSIDPDAVVGKLLRVWTWFDDHTEEGNAPSVSKSLLDRKVGVSGFCDAMISAGWMVEENSGLSIPKFDRHNGATAKSRCLTAKRVSKHKSEKSKGNAGGNAKGNAAIVSSALPRAEEKRADIETKVSTVRPSFEDVKAFMAAAGSSQCAEPFFNHYEANGWVQGKNKPIKDWRAAARGWISRAKEYAQPPQPTNAYQTARDRVPVLTPARRPANAG